MKLRTRLGVTALALLVPLALGGLYLEGRALEREAGELLEAHLEGRIAGGGLERCASSPEEFVRPEGPPGPPGPGFAPPPGPGFAPPPRPGFGPPPGPPPFAPGGPAPPFQPPGRSDGPPILLFTYDADLRPTVPGAPPLEPGLVAAARAGALPARGGAEGPPGHRVDLLLRRAAPAGRCAFLLAARPRPPFAAAPMLARVWAPPLLAMLAAIALGLGPIVRRIRALEARVRRSAQRDYAPDPSAADRATDEIGALSAAFDEAARAVRDHLEAQEHREQTLRDFLANTTHDVMTPLTVLQGHLIALRNAVASGEPAEPGVVAAAIDEAHYMAALVHNLGVAARLEGGEPHITRAEVDLCALVARVVGRHRPIARQHEVELEHAVPDAPVVVQGDETFLEQAVSNVVYNAIRHHRPGGHASVLVVALDDGAACVSVMDDGPGVKDEDLQRIAQRSVRLDDARTRSPDGQGLGLAITQRVAVLHGASLRFSRGEGGVGLVVELRFPTRAVSSTSAP